jgi:hypothetical protein
VQLYRRHDVWRRIDDNQVVCYRCFEDLEANEFFVQSKDTFWRSGSESLGKQVPRSESQLVDLIGREVPNRRTYPTLGEAVKAFEKLWGGE